MLRVQSPFHRPTSPNWLWYFSHGWPVIDISPQLQQHWSIIHHDSVLESPSLRVLIYQIPWKTIGHHHVPMVFPWYFIYFAHLPMVFRWFSTDPNRSFCPRCDPHPTGVPTWEELPNVSTRMLHGFRALGGKPCAAVSSVPGPQDADGSNGPIGIPLLVDDYSAHLCSIHVTMWMI